MTSADIVQDRMTHNMRLPVSGAAGDSLGPVAAKPILAMLAKETPASGGSAAPFSLIPAVSGDIPRDWAMAASIASSSFRPARACMEAEGSGIACNAAKQGLSGLACNCIYRNCML